MLDIKKKHLLRHLLMNAKNKNCKNCTAPLMLTKIMLASPIFLILINPCLKKKFKKKSITFLVT